jgi:hypothetical protein
MRDIAGLVKILSSLVDRRATSFGEGNLPGKHIPNSGADVVMHSEVGARGKRHFGGAQFELAVEVMQVAENDFLQFHR